MNATKKIGTDDNPWHGAYRRLPSGNWGVTVIPVYGSTPASGDVVLVEKKDGSTRREVIRTVLPATWRDSLGQTRQVCTVDETVREEHPRTTERRYVCANCDKPMFNQGAARFDSSGIAGRVCSLCNKCTRYELSFA